MKLKDFQAQFQRAILEGNDAVLEHLTDGARETTSNLLNVYRDAYTLRLIDVVGNDHEQLRRYLGMDNFRALAAAYIAAHPSHHPNARWFARGLPEYLKSAEAFADRPELAELAALERALNDAFDAEDACVLRIADLGSLPACRVGWRWICSSSVGHELEAAHERGSSVECPEGRRRPAAGSSLAGACACCRLAQRDDRRVPRVSARRGDDVGADRGRRHVRAGVRDDGGVWWRGWRCHARCGHTQNVAGRGAAQPRVAAGRLSAVSAHAAKLPAGTSSGSVSTAPPSRRCSLSSRR